MKRPEILPIRERWECPVCHRREVGHDYIARCLARMPEPIAQVGDFVKIDLGYTWYDSGSTHWVLPGYEVGDAVRYPFIAVVTHVGLPDCTGVTVRGECDLAEWKYTLLSRCIRSYTDPADDGVHNDYGWWGGWTTLGGHYRFRPIESSLVPQACKDDVAAEPRLLGHASRHLL